VTTVAPARAEVRGDGLLAAFLDRRLAARPVPVTPDVPPVVLVAALDRLAGYGDLVTPGGAEGRAVLYVGCWSALVYVASPWTPGTSGCPECLVTRTANSAFGPDRDRGRCAASSSQDRAAAVLGPGVLRIVESCVRAQLAGAHTPDPRVLVVDGAVGSVEPQVLLPDSTCRICGTPERGTLPDFAPAERPMRTHGPGMLRTRQLGGGVVDRDYLFSGLGLFKEYRADLQSPFGACSVELPAQWGRREPAIGRARSYHGARTVAVLEGLERYAGLHRGGRLAQVRAAYADVVDRALYPPDLGTHPPESYSTEGFRYAEFHPETVVDWVWAYSYRRREPVLVPERAAFWGPRHDAEVTFGHDTSNGCALGNSAEEAVLHGLREVAERDAFLLTWYRRLALPEVRLDGAGGELDELLRKTRLFTGFSVRCFLATMEYGMPSFWLAAENTDPAATAGGPVVLAGSGAHPDPRQAIVAGLYELAGIALATRHGYAARRVDAQRMYRDPTLIRRMPDHSLVGALPEARPRYDFLLDGGHGDIALEDVPALPGTWPRERDLRNALSDAVGGILGVGLDVLVVDQTMPELRRHGLHCVRVLVPGLVPMTFGHLNRRTRGLPRLTNGTGIPYPSQLDPGEEAGCVPHPFP
jgi:ribosomal protein S12 methylthiotransferase accessory factor